MRADRQLPEPQRKALIKILERARAVEEDQFRDLSQDALFLNRHEWLEIAYVFEGVSTS